MAEVDRTPEEAAQELVDAWVWWKEDTDLGIADPAVARGLIAKAATPTPTPPPSAAPCPECDSTSPRELSIAKRTRSAAPDGRLRMHDITVLVLEGCPDCGEQTNATDADQFLAGLALRTR